MLAPTTGADKRGEAAAVAEPKIFIQTPTLRRIHASFFSHGPSRNKSLKTHNSLTSGQKTYTKLNLYQNARDCLLVV